MSTDKDDITALREQGDLLGYLKSLTGRPPKQRQASEPEAPCYHIARPGAWPCGTAASGPMPGPSCPDCTPAA
ncbi:hypothetical protein ACFVFF_23100 [Streptomyces sp. NPDC057680]|uniref:hypothetical protein n=1 Tax=Streptomyces sp. NPDC057680 TaxID=3346208 RepID=UPI0036C37D24